MAKNNVATLAGRIKIARERAGLSQTATAKKCGLSRSGYRNYECGYREPGYATLLALAEVLKVKVSELCGETRVKGGRR